MEINEWTGNEQITVKGIITALNEITRLDPDLMQQLCSTRFPCNTAIRDHKTVQTHCYGDASIENPKAGFIGVLNGLIGIDRNKFGPISAIMEKDVVIGFRVTRTASFDKQE